MSPDTHNNFHYTIPIQITKNPMITAVRKTAESIQSEKPKYYHQIIRLSAIPCIGIAACVLFFILLFFILLNINLPSFHPHVSIYCLCFVHDCVQNIQINDFISFPMSNPSNSMMIVSETSPFNLIKKKLSFILSEVE